MARSYTPLQLCDAGAFNHLGLVDLKGRRDLVILRLLRDPHPLDRRLRVLPRLYRIYVRTLLVRIHRLRISALPSEHIKICHRSIQCTLRVEELFLALLGFVHIALELLPALDLILSYLRRDEFAQILIDDCLIEEQHLLSDLVRSLALARYKEGRQLVDLAIARQSVQRRREPIVGFFFLLLFLLLRRNIRVRK